MFGFSINTVTLLYLVASICFIQALKGLSHPTTSIRGNVFGMFGMLIATISTFGLIGNMADLLRTDGLLSGLVLVALGIALGGGIGATMAKKVEMTEMPEMIALYNGMGGGAAAAIAAVELFKDHHLPLSVTTLALIGGIIGSISFTGSLIAFGKLQGMIKGTFRFKGQHQINLLLLLGSIVLSGLVVAGFDSNATLVIVVFVIALLLGVAMTMPIGGGDMAVVISLYNALTGLAVGFEGYVLQNYSMIIAGTVVGAAGTLLTQLMAKAMNKTLVSVLFPFGEIAQASGDAVEGEMKPIEAGDAGIMMAFAQNVIIIPGYGMAVAQAQQKVWELSQLLIDRGVDVKFAIHPVAGRMPGHMNVLLAEANVPYDEVLELDEINRDFSETDVAFVIGANDVTNPAAKTDKTSAIYGMPILDVENAGQVFFVKRGMASGYAGVQNELFFRDNTLMLFGDAKKVCEDIIKGLED